MNLNCRSCSNKIKFWGQLKSLKRTTWSLYIVWEWCEHSLVSGALLVAVTVSSAAGVGTAAVTPPPLPGAGAGATPLSRGRARASSPAVTWAWPAVESKRSENFSKIHFFVITLNCESSATNGQLHPNTGKISSGVKRTLTFYALCYVIWSWKKQNKHFENKRI